MKVIKNFLVDLTELFFCNSYDEIIPGIYLGNKNSANDYNLVKNISLIVNCTEDIPFYFSDLKINRFRVSVPDDQSLDSNLRILTYINPILPAIHTCYTQKKKILIHCRAGSQRSATLLACYLIKYHNFTKDMAITFIKSKRSITFFPGPNFNITLEIFEKKFRNNLNSC